MSKQKNIGPVYRFLECSVIHNGNLHHVGNSSIVARRVYDKLVSQGLVGVQYIKKESVITDMTQLEEKLPPIVYKFINAEGIGRETNETFMIVQEIAELYPEYADLVSYFIKKDREENNYEQNQEA